MHRPMPAFIDNPAIRGREEKFVSMRLQIAAVLESWRESLFAHEWLRADGSLKATGELTDKNRVRRQDIEAALNAGHPLPKPVLGIGLTDGIEIGAGKDILLTLAGLSEICVDAHVPKSCADDFHAFLG